MRRAIKTLYVLIILLFIADAFSLINIQISRKYEIDLLSTDYEISHSNKKSIYERQIELNNQANNCKIRLIIYVAIIATEYAYEILKKD